VPLKIWNVSHLYHYQSTWIWKISWQR